MMQKVDLRRPLVSDSYSPAPLAVGIAFEQRTSISEGVPAGRVKLETYVLLSALPEELRQRVKLAVQALAAGM